MNTEVKLRKNGHRHGGGWKPDTPRKSKGDIMIPLYVMVKTKNYTKAKIYLTNEAKKFR